MPLSGGRLLTPVSRNAGQVPAPLGAWNSPFSSSSGNCSVTTIWFLACTAPEW
ncbi:hypothetical protein [Streptomyces sparsogenes]|uniref:hypothetical protein n=1 Tax=Streptomyces sparsogenes TaxID=67365 RepID=UPI001301E490|nr:hypothetical protein [Streptomyces sparsogenes]